MKRTIKDIYELIKEKRANAIKDMSSKGVLSVDNPIICELKGEIDAYYDIQTLIESSGLLDENANVDVEDEAKTILEEISKAFKISMREQDCLVKHFNLVKVIMPTDVIEELRKRTKEVIKEDADPIKGIAVRVSSVPIEEDKCARRIRYVIEGDLQIL